MQYIYLAYLQTPSCHSVLFDLKKQQKNLITFNIKHLYPKLYKTSIFINKGQRDLFLQICSHLRLKRSYHRLKMHPEKGTLVQRVDKAFWEVNNVNCDLRIWDKEKWDVHVLLKESPHPFLSCEIPGHLG